VFGRVVSRYKIMGWTGLCWNL